MISEKPVSMNSEWKNILLKDILSPNNEQIQILPDASYKQVTIRLWGKGIALRDTIEGMEVSGNLRRVVRTGQFIMSKIDARHGAFGIVPEQLDGAIVSNDFPSYIVNEKIVLPQFLFWLSKTHMFVDLCRQSSEGSTNRVRLKDNRFLNQSVCIPTIKKQQQFIEYLNNISIQIGKLIKVHDEMKVEAVSMLKSAFAQIIRNAPLMQMREIAPIVRRPIEIKMDDEYWELGIRSFGKGTFHKPALDYFTVGNKRLFRIKSGDLLFSNVFAWEGAIAVAQPEDDGKCGSHRFVSCVPKHGIATSNFLCFYFLTKDGLDKIGQASPGGAGRNRTLGLDKLANIMVPIPSIDKQQWFNELLLKVNEYQRIQKLASIDTEALMPSAVDSVFIH